MRRRLAAALLLSALLCTAVLFAACDVFSVDVTIGQPPDHVASVSVSCNGQTPILWEGEHWLFEYGDKVTVRVNLDAFYELGDMTMLLNGRPVKLSSGTTSYSYLYEFVITTDVSITFEGAPVAQSRNISFVCSNLFDAAAGSMSVYFEDWERLGLQRSYTFDMLANGAVTAVISQTETLKFAVGSRDYLRMPTADAVSGAGSVAPVAGETRFEDGVGYMSFSISPGVGDAMVYLNPDFVPQPTMEVKFNPSDIFFSVAVGGETPSPGFSIETLASDPRLVLTLSPTGESIYREMTAKGVPLEVTVNGTVLTDLSVGASDSGTTITAALAPACTYADGAANGFFAYEVSCSISSFAALDPQIAVRVPLDRKAEARWLAETPSVEAADEQPSLIYADGGGSYYLLGEYVVLDAYVPTGVRDGVPTYDFAVDGGDWSGIYDADDAKSFAADDSDVKIIDGETVKAAGDGSAYPYKRLYKVYVKAEVFARGDLEIVFGSR